MGSLLLTLIILIAAWLSNYIRRGVWDKIIISKFVAVDVWEWTSSFILHFA